MADKDGKDAQNIAPPDVAIKPGGTVEEPEVEPVKPVEPEPQAPEVDERFQGKSAEELVQDYKNLESHAGRLAQQLDDARRQAQQLQQMQQAQQAQQPQAGANQGWQQPPQLQSRPELPTYDEEFIDKPTEATRKIVSEELRQFNEEQRYRQAMTYAPIAKQQAKSMYPQIFEGLEDNEIDQFMYGGVQSRMLEPELMQNPEGWRMVAWELKGRKSGFSMKPQPPIPTTPTSTELPTPVKAQSSATQTPPTPAGWDEVWEKMGIKPEHRDEILKEQAKGKK